MKPDSRTLSYRTYRKENGREKEKNKTESKHTVESAQKLSRV